MGDNPAFVKDDHSMEMSEVGRAGDQADPYSLPEPPAPISVDDNVDSHVFTKIVLRNEDTKTSEHHQSTNKDNFLALDRTRFTEDHMIVTGEDRMIVTGEDRMIVRGAAKASRNSDVKISVVDNPDLIHVIASKKKEKSYNANEGLTDDSDEESVYESDDDDDEKTNKIIKSIHQCGRSLSQTGSLFFKVIAPKIKYVLLFLYFCYFGYAMSYEFGTEPSIRLLVCTSIGVIIIVNRLIGSYVTDAMHKQKETKVFRWSKKLSKWFLYIAMFAFAVVYIVVEIGRKKPENLASLAGMVGYILLSCLLSSKVTKVQWRTVFWGVSIQFILAIVVLRTTWGVDGITWLSDRVNELMEYGYQSSTYVFGESYAEHRFLFKSLPLIFLINSFITVLYHIGAMGWIVRTFGQFLSFALGCTPAESMSVVANIFLGSTQAALAIKPFLSSMSSSEVFALMVGGFSSVSTSTIGLYIQVGAKASHVITACILSAPAALAIAKIIVPEKIPGGRKQDYSKVNFGKYNNILEAAATGAMDSIQVFASVLINLYVFYALLKFVDSTLMWFGSRAGLEDFGFRYVCSYLLFPLPLLMGVELADCRALAKVLAVKLTTSNLVGFTYLGDFLDNSATFSEYTSNPNNTWHYVKDDIVLDGLNKTLVGGILSPRTAAIGTFALCGFSNFVSIGIALGTYLALMPKKKAFITRIIFRGMIAGNFACYMTACIAGLFYED